MIVKQSNCSGSMVVEMMKNGDEGVIEINTAPITGPRIVAHPFCQSDNFVIKRVKVIDLTDVVTIIE